MEIETLIKFFEDNFAKDITYYSKPREWLNHVIILNATSKRHIGALINELKLKKLIKLKEVEGSAESEWVVFHVKGIVVHIFTKEKRDFYTLDDIFKNKED